MLSSYEEELRRSRERKDTEGYDKRGGRPRRYPPPPKDGYSEPYYGGYRPRPDEPTKRRFRPEQKPKPEQNPDSNPGPGGDPEGSYDPSPGPGSSPGPSPGPGGAPDTRTSNQYDPSKERMDDPFLTFPGHMYSNPPGPGPYPDPAYGPPPGGMGMGMPPSYYPPYYPYYPKRPMDAFGATAITLGIVSMCIFWLSVIPYLFGTVIYVVIICMTGLGIIFGGYSFASKRRRSIPGLIGMILSIIAIILATILWSYTNYMWGTMSL